LSKKELERKGEKYAKLPLKEGLRIKYGIMRPSGPERNVLKSAPFPPIIWLAFPTPVGA
jgi:hypothetical protein